MEAVVLLSGGLDSTTCLTAAVERHGADNVLAVSFFYGQKHSQELEQGEKIAAYFGVERKLIELPHIFGEAGSTLVSGGPDNPKGTYEDLPDGVSPTYVPYRNGTLLSLASVVAASVGAKELWFGAHAEDAERWAYPDCTPEFIGSQANAIYVGTYHQVRLITPLEWMTKAEVVAWGLKLNAPYQLSLSCYNGTIPACGECPTCNSRREAFTLNGTTDPIEYRQKVEA